MLLRLEIFAEEKNLICAFRHILTLPNTKIIFNFSNMRVQAMIFKTFPGILETSVKNQFRDEKLKSNDLNQ